MRKITLRREFFHYTLMNIIGMIGLSCYILADTFFIARGLGAAGLAALNLAIPVYSFVHGSGLMIGMGGATKYSIFKGQKNLKNAEGIFTHAIYLAGILAFAFCMTGLFFSGDVAEILGAKGKVFVMTRTYLKYILLFSPAFLCNDILICFVRNDGKPRLAMAAMLVGSFSNILLDYLFIFPLKMGIFGAVLATGMAPVISMGVLSIHFWKRENHFTLIRTRLNLGVIKASLQLGVPSLITEVAAGIVMIVFNMIILRIEGNVGVAAYGVIANLSLVAASIYTGIAQGAQPLLSRAYGRGEKAALGQIRRYAVVTLLVISAVVYLLVFVKAEEIAALFNREENVRMGKMAAEGLRIYFTALPFMGYNIVASAFSAATEKAAAAQTIALLRGILLILPMACLLSYLAGLTGVWLALPVTEGLTAVFAVIWLRSFHKRKV